MMHMTLYWGKDATILLKSWSTTTWGSYLTALIVTFIFCMLHEWLTTYRLQFLASKRSKKRFASHGGDDPTIPLVDMDGQQLTSLHKAIGTSLYAVNAACSYIIMLIVMTFNGGLFLAVVFGLACGYFFFGITRNTIAASSEICCAE
eukprot:jgi/Mesen1/4989/ME000248S04277